MSDSASLWSSPGSAEYLAATSPLNTTAHQHPAFVARPTTTVAVAAVVRAAAAHGLQVVPQSTGHGAGGVIGNDAVILDTSALDALTIDPTTRTATIGAGLTWGRVNAEAERVGLLAPSGSAPTVGVCGYTFGGGVGWLVRAHGMASAALRRVEYVTGDGAVHIAAEDADDPMDRDALWAFRGGGGVGVATRLEIDLFAVSSMHAGYFLWPAAALEDVVDAWAAALPGIGEDVATSLSVLHLPDVPAFPDELRGAAAVHLGIASPAADLPARPLIDAVTAAVEPSVAVWGPADAAALGRIHLDPPAAVPALGRARWATATTPSHAAAILALGRQPGSPFALVEVRHVATRPSSTNGAVTTPAGDFIVHAVAPAVGPDAETRVAAAFDEFSTAIEPVDAGTSVSSWVDGAAKVSDGLPATTRAAVAAVADAVDPDHVIARPRDTR